MGVCSEDSLVKPVKMFKLVFVIAVAAAAPLEDTAEVIAARAEFQAAFDRAAAGEHAALAPVNNDIQAEQIADDFLEDAEDVAAAKAEFTAAFEAAAAGGLAELQAPAPVHEIPAVEPLAAPAPVPAPVYTFAAPAAFPYYAYNLRISENVAVQLRDRDKAHSERVRSLEIMMTEKE